MDNNTSFQHGSSFAPRRVKKRGAFNRFKPFLIIASVIILATFAWSFLSSTSSVFKYAFSQNSSLKSTDNRVNVLLLGNAGGTHDGPDLTDSIIIASYQIKTHKVTLISIPRDLWIDGSQSKVNATYEIGKSKTGDGLKYAEDKIDDILGIPIHYGIRIDFSGFAKAIDLVGGVDVEVANTFDDYRYPITGKEDDLCGNQEKEVELSEEDAKKVNLKPGKQKVIMDSSGKIATESASFACRYEHIHFDRGSSHLDGTTALKYVRSRMGTNGEGSDFARSRRQQLVIQSFRSKVLSLQTLTNPQKIGELYTTFGKSVETDIPAENYLELLDLVRKQEGSRSLVLGDLGDGKSILTNPPPSQYGGAYVLVPPNNDFSSVKDFLKQKLLEDDVTIFSPAPSIKK